MFVPAVAQAACSTDKGPPPPLNANFADRRFDSNEPFRLLATTSESGCAGANAPSSTNGEAGRPGQPGGDVTSTAANVVIVRPTSPPLRDSIAAVLQSTGGNGGHGGDGGDPLSAATIGGTGGTGGRSGAVTFAFSGSIVSDGSGLRAGTGIIAGVKGGDGGNAGDSPYFAFETKNQTGGNGGVGGGAGSVRVSGAGDISVLNNAVLLVAQGGDGGGGGSVQTSNTLLTLRGGDAGIGGAGGAAAIEWHGGAITAGRRGLDVFSAGGRGGGGGSTTGASTTYGGKGGAGGVGGSADVLLQGGKVTIVETDASTRGGAVVAVSAGGEGGDGGLGGSALGVRGGNGGIGGAGGSASATVFGAEISLTAFGSAPTQAIYVSSFGGAGGKGGNARALTGSSGGGGLAGAGGSVSLTLGNAAEPVNIATAGRYGNAAIVQSIGGGGGNGGAAAFFIGTGGAGAPGGDGGVVNASISNGVIVTTGPSAGLLVAQSVGGGGGVGGDASSVTVGAGIAIGGNGGFGGNGGAVNVNLGTEAVLVSRNPEGNGGVLAQSIGGSGGAGGSAISKGSGILTLTIGGDSEGGGTPGAVSITSGALVSTAGSHAHGLQAQSIGGGGGTGGSAFSFNVGVLPTSSIAVGGGGGGGGAANDAVINNNGQVTTFGPDAFGVIAQSIGGGGGSGGAAAARAVTIGLSDELPSISIAVSTGGKGGGGNTGAAAILNNTGTVATQGEGATALVSQSIGGGGGTGGDSTAASFSSGRPDAVTISVSVAVGGAGGTGGTGGKAELHNSGLVVTLGGDAHGLLAQSVGGGGGLGGGGDAGGTAGVSEKGGMALAIGVGGKGGTGGTGGMVVSSNAGGISTLGDGSDGMFVQSVGGGGGIGGGGVANANGPKISITVGVGGGGGAGGDGGTVEALNSGAIVTRGTDAVGLFAQSVGGGGGKGGKGGATAGGVNPLSEADSLITKLSDGFGLDGEVKERVDGVFEVFDYPEKLLANAEEIARISQQLKGSKKADLFKVNNLDVGVAVGGRGGAAGGGEHVSVTNTGQISTFGAESDGIFAQSIGGGGGKGGAASSTDKSANDFRNQSAIAVGGDGGGGGSGGAISVANAETASIITRGVLGFGIYAQSVGGGGGDGAIAGVVSGALRSLSVAVGGNGGRGGDGGVVNVNIAAGNAATAGRIDTSGKHGIAVLAQSVGGGGGVVRSMTTDETFDPADLIDNPQGRLFDIHGLRASIGGSGGITGSGSTVNVTLGGVVTTTGLGAHGILAQSIGGGGGTVIGGQVMVDQNRDAGYGGSSGNGGDVNVRLINGASVMTAGNGAYGVLAQSIGGGGGVSGDLSRVTTYGGQISAVVKRNNGDASGVLVDLDSASIKTMGDFAPAIFAQSVGGGGGLVNYDVTGGQANIQAHGTAGGDGAGGAVTVAIKNSTVLGLGSGAAGIVAQSDGRTAGRITISVDHQSIIQGGAQSLNTSGSDNAAIRLLGGTDNRIANDGILRGDATTSGGGVAIRGDGAATRTTVVNTGTITGSIILNGSGGGLLDNRPGGRVSATFLVLSEFRNSGTFLPGSPGENVVSDLDGNFVQSQTGTLVVTGGTLANQLNVSGSASLAGTIEYSPKEVRNRPVVVLVASKGVSLDPALTVASTTQLYSFRANVTGNVVELQAQARFNASAAGLGANLRSVATNLQTLFDSGASFDEGFTALSKVNTPVDYAKSLEALAGQGLGAIGAFRFQASNAFVQQLYSGCRAFDRRGAESDETSCAWSRIIGGRTTQDDTANATGYGATSVAFQLGGQREIADDWYVSGSLAYETSQFDDNRALTRVTGDSILGGAYLRYHRGGLQVSGAIDAGYGWFASTRSVSVGGIAGVAHGKAEEWHAGVHGRAAYEVAAGGGYLQPFIDFNAVYVHTGAFTESGLATFGLAVDGQGNTALAGGAGLELGGRIPLKGGGFVRPFVSAAYQLLNHSEWVTTAHFIDQTGSGASFREITPAPDRLGRFAAGLEIVAARDVDLSFQYTPNVGRGYVTHAGTARLSVRF